jgi:enterochelin esterase family protein
MPRFIMLAALLALLNPVTCLAGPGAAPSFRQGLLHPYLTRNPRMLRLAALPPDQRQAEADRIWAEAAKRSTPLVEGDALDDEMVLATFLYRAKVPLKEIKVDIFGIFPDDCMGDRKLAHLEGTDLWYRAYKVPKDLCFSYRFEVTGAQGEKRKLADPLNPRRIPTGAERPISYSVLDLESADTPYQRADPSIPQGSLVEIPFTSTILGNTRTVTVYLPPGYDSATAGPLPVLYLFDSSIYLDRVEAPHVLDHLIAENRIAPLIAVMIGSKYKERRLELALYPPHNDFMLKELIPFVESRFKVSQAPSQRCVGGMSYGGLAAPYLAFLHPERFGKVLSQSGSFWRSSEILPDYGAPDYREDYLVEQFALAGRKDLALFLDWGLLEPDLGDANRRMVKVLARKGYAYQFREFDGWHDWSNSRKSFIQGIQFLMHR